MKQPNTVFLHMFDWFINKYGKMMTEDCKENQQKMAADWHPSDGFEPLVTRLFVGASYASMACYPMNNCNVINIGLRVIKRCGINSEEYKNWKLARVKPRRSSRRSIPSRSTGPARSCCQPEVYPGRTTRLRHGCHGQRCIARVVQQIAYKLWRGLCCHAGNNQDPRDQRPSWPLCKAN